MGGHESCEKAGTPADKPHSIVGLQAYVDGLRRCRRGLAARSISIARPPKDSEACRANGRGSSGGRWGNDEAATVSGFRCGGGT